MTPREAFARGVADRDAGREAYRLEDAYLAGYLFSQSRTLHPGVAAVVRERAREWGFDADEVARAATGRAS